MMMNSTTPVHQWTHDGTDVLVVRQVHDASGTSSYGFVWPLTVGAVVVCPDWDPAPTCGHGLHGWPWGLAVGDGATPNYKAPWLVFGAKPEDVVFLDGKVKVRACVVRHVGTWDTALAYTLAGRIAYTQSAAQGSASATGDAGSASATGDAGSASATGHAGSASATGMRGSASATGHAGSASATGMRGSASATGDAGSASATGMRGSASATGMRGSASATGMRGSASATGDCSVAVVTGDGGRAQAGPFGVVALAWWNATAGRHEMRCAQVVDGQQGTLKPLTWYRLDEHGEFVED